MSLRLVNFRVMTGPHSDAFEVGLMIGERVAGLAELSSACPAEGAASDPADLPRTALDVVIGENSLAQARRCAGWFEHQDAATRERLSEPRADVRLLPPVPSPPKLFCLAQNFPEHAAEASRHITHSGESEADQLIPHVFMKPPSNTICGDGDPIILPKAAGFIDYEGEVAIIIGKRGKHIKAADASDHIAAVTCINDVSERELKIRDRPDEREWDRFFDWLNGKWFDSFAPMGPCLVPAQDVDVDDLDLTCAVNGEIRQRGNTGEMFHSAAQTIEYISQMLTLEPGDIIAMGTPAGVGKALGIKLRPGDEVTVEVGGVGVLTNPVVAQ